MIQIVKRAAGILNISINEDGAAEIAKRSRGTPRISNRLLKRVRDFAQVKGKGDIDYDIAANSLEAMDVDRYGFDNMDRKILHIILEKFSGGPVGIDTIAAATQEEIDTISDVYEPFLIQSGFLARTPRGRVATVLAAKHLGIKLMSENELFQL